jgi:endonuclease VIII
MPEGPEIRRTTDRLAAALAGRAVEELFFAFPTLKSFEKELAGCEVLTVFPRAKAVLIRFDNGLTVYSHNQLYGIWEVVARGELPETKRQLRLALHTAEISCLLYSASDIEVLDEEGVKRHRFLRRLGPDVLAGETDLEVILDRYRADRFQGRQVGSLLLEQDFLAGLGNYLRSEILFAAGVDPHARLRDLGAGQLRRLARQTLKLTVQSYETGGVTNELKRYRRLQEQGISFHDARFRVFDREGEDCYYCGERIEKTSVSSRRLYFCPTCQAKE